MPETHLGSLVGREAELATLREYLDGDRLVTVLGTAGVGKTRLALELAARWPGRVVFCQLAAARTPDDLVDRVAQALQVELGAPAGDAAYRQLGAALSIDGPLLVLDTVDRAVVPLAEALTQWMSAAPSARF